MPIVPVCTRRATSMARLGSALKTARPKPYRESLAMRTASASSRYGITANTGPKIFLRARGGIAQVREYGGLEEPAAFEIVLSFVGEYRL